MTVTLLTCVAAESPASLGRVGSALPPRVVGLVRSPLLQGGVLAAIEDLLRALVRSSSTHLGYR